MSTVAVRHAASYLGVSIKGLQNCLDRGYDSRQAAQYLGVSAKAIQRTFVRFQVLVVGIAANDPGKTVRINVTGAKPNGGVQITWGDGTTTSPAADSAGEIHDQLKVYATVGTFGIFATDTTTGYVSATVSVTTKA